MDFAPSCPVVIRVGLCCGARGVLNDVRFGALHESNHLFLLGSRNPELIQRRVDVT